MLRARLAAIACAFAIACSDDCPDPVGDKACPAHPNTATFTPFTLPVASAPDAQLLGSARDDVWLADLTAGSAFHFDGTSWATVALPSQTRSVGVRGRGRLWTVGDRFVRGVDRDGTSDDHGATLGLTPDSAVLFRAARGGAYAYVRPPRSTEPQRLYRWDGTTFQPAPLPIQATDAVFQLLEMTGPTHLFAFHEGANLVTGVSHFDGQTWAPVARGGSTPGGSPPTWTLFSSPDGTPWMIDNGVQDRLLMRWDGVDFVSAAPLPRPMSRSRAEAGWFAVGPAPGDVARIVELSRFVKSEQISDRGKDVCFAIYQPCATVLEGALDTSTLRLKTLAEGSVAGLGLGILEDGSLIVTTRGSTEARVATPADLR